MKLTVEQLNKWREFVSHHAIEHSIVLYEHSNQEIIACCNGIGSEAMPEAIRSFLDRLLPSMQIAAGIHDLEYQFSEDRSDEAFHASNARFQRNCIAVCKVLYGWYDPRRYLAMHDARRFRAILDLCGKSAWKAAGRKGLSQKTR